MSLLNPKMNVLDQISCNGLSNISIPANLKVSLSL